MHKLQCNEDVKDLHHFKEPDSYAIRKKIYGKRKRVTMMRRLYPVRPGFHFYQKVLRQV